MVYQCFSHKVNFANLLCSLCLKVDEEHRLRKVNQRRSIKNTSTEIFVSPFKENCPFWVILSPKSPFKFAHLHLIKSAGGSCAIMTSRSHFEVTFRVKTHLFTVNTARSNGGGNTHTNRHHMAHRVTPDGPRTTVWVTRRRGETAWLDRDPVKTPQPNLVQECPKPSIKKAPKQQHNNSPCPEWMARQQKATTRTSFILTVHFIVVVCSQYGNRVEALASYVSFHYLQNESFAKKLPLQAAQPSFRCVIPSFGASL